MFPLFPAKRLSRRGWMLALAVSLSGCFETKQEFTLNPDGSGKVVHESVFARSAGGFFNQDERASLEEQLQTAVKDVLKDSSGVEAWRDVSFRRLADGRIYFQGTGYFPDLANVNIHDLTAVTFEVTKHKNGGMIVRATGASGEDEKAKRSKPRHLTEQELARKVLRERASFQEMRPMIAGWAATLKQEITLRLPGPAAAVTNFRKIDERTVALSYGGAKILAAIDEASASDQWWRKQVRAGVDVTSGGGDFDDDEVNAKIFGEAAPVRVVIPPGAPPQFDYAAEVATAKIEYAALTKRLGITPEEKAREREESAAPGPPPPPGAPLHNLRVTGVRFVYEDEGAPLPFGSRRGLTLALRGEFGGKVLHATGGEIHTATAADGTSLRLDKTAIPLSASALQDDAVSFEVEIALPPGGVASLDELSGEIQYLAAGAARKTDFGLGKLKTGATGREFGARIESYEQPAGDRRGGLELKLKIGPWRIKALRFLDAAGKELKVTESSSSSGDDHVEYKYSFDDPLPPGARLEAEIYDPLEKQSAPFNLEHLPLLGRP